MLLLAVVAIAPGVSIVAGVLLMIPAPQMIAVFGLITGATNQGGAIHFPKSSNDGVRPDGLVTILTRHPAAMQSADFEILHKASSRKSVKRREFTTLPSGRFFASSCNKGPASLPGLRYC
jgi:hypothetical protein